MLQNAIPTTPHPSRRLLSPACRSLRATLSTQAVPSVPASAAAAQASAATAPAVTRAITATTHSTSAPRWPSCPIDDSNYEAQLAVCMHMQAGAALPTTSDLTQAPMQCSLSICVPSPAQTPCLTCALHPKPTTPTPTTPPPHPHPPTHMRGGGEVSPVLPHPGATACLSLPCLRRSPAPSA